MKSGPLEHEKDSKGLIPRISSSSSGVNRGVSIVDFVLRLFALIGTLGSAISMGTTDETLPFFTQFVRFKAEYDDLPSFGFPLDVVYNFMFFVAANAVAMLDLLTAAASAAPAIVYLAHEGNARANWFAIWQQFNSFCERISGSLIGSFGGIVMFILIILFSSIAISRH
ncbi:Uncharacterized protein family UPF0497 [Macleaya cordata]|uniref:CASP-like protein n=1 Tax=Macleaya cordata TaxID=56857 RepID=A0A200QP45_MACCD|nr:Uncharacterized protein family UPF0497 [Macleaya cordata]